MLVKNLIITLVISVASADDTIVNTIYGKVKGEQLTTLLEKKAYYSFKGIPYAAPPIGSLRFKPPQKPTEWTDIRDAVKYGSVCLQGNFTNPNVFVGNEDCLFINVFTPDINPAQKLPVIFGIHGGAFAVGGGEMMGPDFLINQDVILVTFNYRVGPPGFLSLGTPEYSGNMGLKDQLLALKWTNENIEFFGGNRSQITIIGESAGGASVHYHLLSPQSKGLFKHAIVACGTAFNPWAFYNKRDHIQIIKDYGVRVNYPLYDIDDIVEFLNQSDPSVLTRYTYQQFLHLEMGRQDIGMIWAPLVEHPDTKDAFLLASPDSIMNGNYETSVDVLLTYATHEMKIAEYATTDKITSNLDAQFEIHLPLAEANINYKSKAYKEIATKIRKYYFSEDGTIKSSDRKNYVDFLSDTYFVYGIHKAIQLFAEKSTGRTYNWIYSGIPDFGASHTEDTSYIFSRNSFWPLAVFYDDYSDEIRKVIKNISSLVAQFARTGNPTPNQEPVDFKPVLPGEYNYLNITRRELIPSVNPPETKTFTFWEGIFKEYF